MTQHRAHGNAWLLVAAACSSCTTQDPAILPDGPITGWSFIATVDGLDEITHCHLRSLLKSSGIDCSLEGSVAYDVSVPTKNRTQAIALITDDLRTRPCKITLHIGTSDRSYTIPDESWVEDTPRLLLRDLLATEPYTNTPSLSALFRSPDLTTLAMTFPHVNRVKLLTRPYLDAQHTPRTGYDVEMEMTVNLTTPIGTCRARYQVWDEGNQIAMISSDEWWPGDKDTAEKNKRLYDKRPPGKLPRFTE